MELSLFPQEGLFGVTPGIAAGGIFFGLGMLFLLFGWHGYRIALVTVGVLVGSGFGAALASLVNLHPLFFALPLGILCGILAVSLEKLGAIFIGGLVGAIPIIALRGEFQSTAVYYICLALAFLIAGIIAIYLWKAVIVFFLTVIGAAFIVNGIALTAERLSPGSGNGLLSNHPLFVLVGLLGMVIFGFYFQTGGKANGKPATA
jgi:hypothetical protein